MKPTLPAQLGIAVAQIAAMLAIAVAVTAALVFTQPAFSDDVPSGENRMSREAAQKLKSPIPFTKESIARGRTLYIRDCTECHGADGKSQVDVVANATDLTDPKLWTSGTSEGEIFRSIRDGAGDGMPPFVTKIDKEEDIWHLVNYIRGLWPDGARPKLAQP
jgi:mono/diheme cytochrome c family protein